MTFIQQGELTTTLVYTFDLEKVKVSVKLVDGAWNPSNHYFQSLPYPLVLL